MPSGSDKQGWDAEQDSLQELSCLLDSVSRHSCSLDTPWPWGPWSRIYN